MKKSIKLSENELHSIITESVKRVLNELDSKTYYNAGKQAYQLGQFNRGEEFYKAANNTLNNELGTNNDDILFTPNGFECLKLYLAYDKRNDALTYLSKNGESVLKPGESPMRLKDRKLIRAILQYFAKYKPDSKYNDKNYWIA